jgi:hypothetical protein
LKLETLGWGPRGQSALHEDKMLLPVKKKIKKALHEDKMLLPVKKKIKKALG